ncbi:aldehyde dehydrogenase family 3 member H1 [Tanacetum coccineum]
MASEQESKKSTLFDASSAETLVKDMRRTVVERIKAMNRGKPEHEAFIHEIAMIKSSCKSAMKNLKGCNEEFKRLDEARKGKGAKTNIGTEFILLDLTHYFTMQIAMIKSSCKLAMKNLKGWMKPEKAKTNIGTFPSSAEIVSEPLGVVLIISARNYPLLLYVDPVIGAIAAGNAVVLKPSEISPATSSLLAKLFAEHLDNSAMKVVEGAVAETSALLEQKWDKIFYTRNGRVARVVMAVAAKHLTPVVLELGGKCPVFVDSDIDLTVTARRIVSGKWGTNNGQACVTPENITLVDIVKLRNFSTLRTPNCNYNKSLTHINRAKEL